MNRGVGKKGICRIWFIGADIFLPHCLVTSYLKLGSKSDHRTEISWNIVQYDALVPRPEGLRSIPISYFVCAWAVGKKKMQIESD